MAVPAARSEILKTIGALNLDAFIATYKANELAERLARLLLPAPRGEHSGPDAQLGQGRGAPDTTSQDYFVV